MIKASDIVKALSGHKAYVSAGKKIAKALLSGETEESRRAVRMSICAKCKAVDSGGVRLYRLVKGKPFCGKPFCQKADRDEKIDGCGCNLNHKTRWRESECPRGYWGKDK